jgi:hypothetical protein
MASRQRLSIVGLGAQGSAYAQMISDRTVPSVAIGVTTSADQSRRQHPNRRPPKRRSWPRSGPPVPPAPHRDPCPACSLLGQPSPRQMRNPPADDLLSPAELESHDHAFGTRPFEAAET